MLLHRILWRSWIESAVKWQRREEEESTVVILKIGSARWTVKQHSHGRLWRDM